MMYFILLISFLLQSNSLSAQSYMIREVVELKHDLAARTKSVEDTNGKACALIRISIPSVNSIQFDSSVIGNPEYLPGEYNVYIPENSKQLSVDVNGNIYTIVFSKYDIEIEGKKCYRIILSKASESSQSVSKTLITANYDNVVVMVDGIPVGQTPLVLENISSGQHTLSVPNTFGVTMKDSIVYFSEENKIELTLHKEKRKPVYVDMATPGGDTYSWYKVFGTNVKEVDGKKGVVDYTGNILVPFEFDYIFPGIQNGYYVVYKDEKAGLYEPGKGLVVPCIYDCIVTNNTCTHNDYMPVNKNNKWGVLSPFGKLIVPLEYENTPGCYKDGILVEKGKSWPSNWGILSYNGDPIIIPQYSNLNEFINGYAIFSKFVNINYRPNGFVDKYGKERIIPQKYGVGSFGINGAIVSSGLFRVQDRETEKWGYMDTNLNLVIPTIGTYEYGDAPNFEQGFVHLITSDDEIIYDNKGKVVLSKKEKGYKSIGMLHLSEVNSYCYVINEEEKLGILNMNGKTIIPLKYDKYDLLYDGSEKLLVLKNKNTYDIFNSQLQLLFSLPVSLSIVCMSDGIIMIKDEETKSYGYLNRKGEILANCIYGYRTESESMKLKDSVEKNNGENSYDITEIIEEQPISEGLAILSIGDRFGFIDNMGKIKVPIKYTAVTPFENGIAFVRNQDGKWMKIYKKDL